MGSTPIGRARIFGAAAAVLALVAGTTQVAAAAPSDSMTINVDIALQPRNAAQLATYATQVSDPKSPLYKHFLTKQQSRALFAPTQSQVDKVRTALTAAGLNPGRASDNNMLIPVTATIGQLKQAFGISAFTATSVPKLDASIANDVSGVIGLSNSVKLKSNHRSAGGSGSITTSRQTSHTHGSVPSMCSSFTAAVDSYLAARGQTGQDGGTYYSPTAMASAYGYDQQLNAGNQGQGITVAVEEWEATSRQAVTDYIDCVGAHNTVTYDTTQAGTPTQPTATNAVGTEANLDIEAIASIAPKAAIIDYEGPDITASSTEADLLTTFAAPVAADSANVISLSWGTCEQGDVDTALQNQLTTTLQLAAVQGQSFFVASGDNGSEGCNYQGTDPTLSVNQPTDNPFATAVGGTYMQGLTNPAVTPWNDSDVQTGATGGGVSRWQSMSGAGDYQAGFHGPGYSDACGVGTGGTCRQVPDLSTLAAYRSGFPQMYFADSTGDYVMIDGGTSLSAPVIAGITALADSSAACAADGPAGFVNPTLYDLAKNPATYGQNFQDVTTGDNAYTPSGYTGGLYQAGPGYDMASGLGSPKAAALIPALCRGNSYSGYGKP